MKDMPHKLKLATASCAVLLLVGCWANEDDQQQPPAQPVPVAVTEVPDSAGASSSAFVAFILSLAATDESSEPLTIRDSFAVPADDTSDPTALTPI